MNTPAVSVIVPVYNVAQYIEHCAVSLFEQSLNELEIIFIDDCSKDNSIEIIKETLTRYPNRTNQVRIITMQHNSGQATVRTRGIAEATGEYIIHCDGDDWVDRDLYEKLYYKVTESNADIAICDEIREYENNTEYVVVPDLPDQCKDVIKYFYKKTIGLFCHNKLVKRSLYINNKIVAWDGLNMWEDNGLFARLLYHGGGLCQIHDSFYHYNRKNVNAMTAGYGIEQVNQMIGIAEKLTEFFKNKPDEKDFEKTVLAFQYLARINLITDSFSNLHRYSNTFVGSESIIKELDINAFSAKGRIRFWFAKYNLGWLFVLLFKCRKFIVRHK